MAMSLRVTLPRLRPRYTGRHVYRHVDFGALAAHAHEIMDDESYSKEVRGLAAGTLFAIERYNDTKRRRPWINDLCRENEGLLNYNTAIIQCLKDLLDGYTTKEKIRAKIEAHEEVYGVMPDIDQWRRIRHDRTYWRLEQSEGNSSEPRH